MPAPTPPRQLAPAEDLAQATAKIRELALGRRFRQLPLRSSGSAEERFVRLVDSGTYLRLNGPAAVVMDALDGGTVGEAAERLAGLYGIDSERATVDALAVTRTLQRRGVIAAADATHAMSGEAGTSDLPGLEPDGRAASSA